MLIGVEQRPGGAQPRLRRGEIHADPVQPLGRRGDVDLGREDLHVEAGDDRGERGLLVLSGCDLLLQARDLGLRLGELALVLPDVVGDVVGGGRLRDGEQRPRHRQRHDAADDQRAKPHVARNLLTPRKLPKAPTAMPPTSRNTSSVTV